MGSGPIATFGTALWPLPVPAVQSWHEPTVSVQRANADGKRDSLRRWCWVAAPHANRPRVVSGVARARRCPVVLVCRKCTRPSVKQPISLAARTLRSRQPLEKSEGLVSAGIGATWYHVMAEDNPYRAPASTVAPIPAARCRRLSTWDRVTRVFIGFALGLTLRPIIGGVVVIALTEFLR